MNRQNDGTKTILWGYENTRDVSIFVQPLATKQV